MVGWFDFRFWIQTRTDFAEPKQVIQVYKFGLSSSVMSAPPTTSEMSSGAKPHQILSIRSWGPQACGSSRCRPMAEGLFLRTPILQKFFNPIKNEYSH